MAKGKNSAPFLRGKRGTYYCWIEGRLLSLKTDKPRLAEGKYRELLGEARKGRAAAEPRTLTVRECFDLYLEHAKGFKSGTADRRQVFEAFCRGGVGDLPHDRLTAERAEAWIASHVGWASSTARTRMNHLNSAFNFCVKRKRIAANPIRHADKPQWERRKVVIGKGDSEKLLEHARGEFLEILVALRETGARPSELCRAQVGDYAAGVIVLAEHKEDGGGEPRTIYLTPELRARVERLIGSRTEGPIWRNGQGGPWTRWSILARFTRMREKHKLGPGVFPYAMRHRFASDAINESDANPAMVARLLGHANMDMVLRHYFRENPEAALRALEAISKVRKRSSKPDDS